MPAAAQAPPPAAMNKAMVAITVAGEIRESLRIRDLRFLVGSGTPGVVSYGEPAVHIGQRVRLAVRVHAARGGAAVVAVSDPHPPGQQL
jgi:hypothetical protein